MDTRQNITYMLYVKYGKGITDIVGPIFSHELDLFKSQYAKGSKVYMQEESSFKSHYPRHYNRHIHHNWIDKVYTYMKTNELWIGKANVSVEQQVVYSEWLNVTLHYAQPNQSKQVLIVNTIINTNEFYQSRVIVDLMAIFPNFLVKKGSFFYNPRTGGCYENAEALRKFLADKLIDKMSLN